mgnify:CR=1 FL=1
MPWSNDLRTLIIDHLEDLENNRLPVISKKTSLSIERIQEIWDELRKLKPKPGSEFSESMVPTVTPDGNTMDFNWFDREGESGADVCVTQREWDDWTELTLVWEVSTRE